MTLGLKRKSRKQIVAAFWYDYNSIRHQSDSKYVTCNSKDINIKIGDSKTVSSIVCGIPIGVIVLVHHLQKRMLD